MNDFETKQAIVDALKKFQSSPLGEAASGLLGVLGYTSKKRLALKPNTLANFLATFSQGRSLNERHALPKEWKSVDFLFQITDDEIRAAANMQFDFESRGAFNGAIINSYLFIAIELKQEHYSRSTLAGITREVNKLFDMPALIFFRHGETITLAVINRRLHKREPGKDVLEKVTLIQDIRLTNTHRAHIEILNDLSLSALHQKHPFTNFVGLHEAWQKTLDTSELNKRFFQDLANWYFWALPQVRFPKNAPKDADGQDSMSLIRLITRIIFCWFLKEKGLLPSALFDEHKIPELLIDLSPKESTYYKAILQNLFFATLNQEMGKREFRKANQNFMAHNVYRYRSLLKSPNDLLNFLAKIPFMNGGLFECLDKTLGTKENPQYIRIDGFSDRDDNALKIPNSLFWGPERVVDLSEAYGEDKYSASRVAGLVRIFDRYKFTVAENTPIDEEVALDPELLGKAFENLLAAYNPETGATARKQTGSFYTPREIVNYMVDESLISSLSTKLKVALPKAAQVEERLRQLVAYSNEPHQFADHEVTALIYAIDHLKILDPACGSGAFPMGILHKLVYVLAKLDPGNQRWKDRQLAKANEIPDSTVRERVVSDIEQSFNANELDYGRKLYLIENCIYGVDIQPIAVQISKLRFFISLVVDQRINEKADNLGIRPLPNLETKFVAANTLIALERPGQQLLRNIDIDAKEAELRQVRERHFLARTPGAKAKCREHDANLRAEIAGLLRADGWDSTTSKKLAAWNPYDQNAWAGFFDSEWMFGNLNGFDILIGNPPYGAAIDQESKVLYLALYKHQDYQLDSYLLFMERASTLLRPGGELCFIVSNTWLSSITYRKLRSHMVKSYLWERFLVPREGVFKAVVDTHVFLFQLKPTSRPVIDAQVDFLGSEGLVAAHTLKASEIPDDGSTLNIVENDTVQAVFRKMRKVSAPIKQHFDVYNGSKPFEKGKGTPPQSAEIMRTKPYVKEGERPVGKHWMPLLRGSLIQRYTLLWQQNYWIKYGPWLAAPRSPEIFECPEKIVVRQTGDSIIATVIAGGMVARDNLHLIIQSSRKAFSLHYLVGVLNSRAIEFFYGVLNPEKNEALAQVKKAHVESLPVPNCTQKQATDVEKLVRRVLSAKERNSSADTLELEASIDRIVYDLFSLTPEEVEIVEMATPSARPLAEARD